MTIRVSEVFMRPVSGDGILYSSVRMIEWQGVVGAKRTLRLFTDIASYPVVNLSEDESYDFAVAWYKRRGDESQLVRMLQLRDTYLKCKERKQCGV